MTNCTTITRCLACGETDLVLTLDLGQQPLANNFRQQQDGTQESHYPLAINRCQSCDHLQLTHAVDPRLIYTHYLYVSGTSQTYVEYMDWYARFVHETYSAYTNQLGPFAVLDIGCNDGSQLTAFKNILWRTYGVDPATNLYPVSSLNHSVICDFWPTDQGFDTQFDVITAQNSFAHNPDPLAWLLAATQRLKNNGKIFISTSQADMVANGEFDTIYHEHISYYNAQSMQHLARRAGLYLIDVVKTPIHGTSYIFVLSKQSANQARIENVLATESRLHLASTYQDWAETINQLLTKLKDQIDQYRAQGYAVVGYGAAAKGMTLINASKIDLECVIDDNPLKQGLYCPGTTIPVVGINWLKENDRDRVVFVPLAWNFYTEIVKKILAVRNNNTDLFLRYFPTITAESL